jgi:co-chaperonin GroES (HSP10)
VDSQNAVEVMNGYWLHPAPNQVIVKYDAFVYKGKLVIPDTAKRLGTTGVVQAIGPFVDRCKVGDRVLWATFSGTQFHFRRDGVDEVFIILNNNEVKATVDPSVSKLEFLDASAG